MLHSSQATAPLLLPAPARLMAGKRVSVCRKRVIPLIAGMAQASLMADPSTLIEQMASGCRTRKLSLLLSPWALNYSTPIHILAWLVVGCRQRCSPHSPGWRHAGEEKALCCSGSLRVRKGSGHGVLASWRASNACFWIQDRPFMPSESKISNFSNLL